MIKDKRIYAIQLVFLLTTFSWVLFQFVPYFETKEKGVVDEITTEEKVKE
jgi:hypothetical protein